MTDLKLFPCALLVSCMLSVADLACCWPNLGFCLCFCSLVPDFSFSWPRSCLILRYLTVCSLCWPWLSFWLRFHLSFWLYVTSECLLWLSFSYCCHSVFLPQACWELRQVTHLEPAIPKEYPFNLNWSTLHLLCSWPDALPDPPRLHLQPQVLQTSPGACVPPVPWHHLQWGLGWRYKEGKPCQFRLYSPFVYLFLFLSVYFFIFRVWTISSVQLPMNVTATVHRIIHLHKVLPASYHFFNKFLIPFQTINKLKTGKHVLLPRVVDLWPDPIPLSSSQKGPLRYVLGMCSYSYLGTP